MEDAAAAKPTPPAMPPQSAGTAAPATPWSTGLFGCMDDPGNCLLTFVCPCVTFGRMAEIVDRGATSSGASTSLYTVVVVLTWCECQWVYSCFYRNKIRAQYGLQETPLPDYLVHFLCEPCAICQLEYHELSNRGFDMDIGWHTNMQQGRGSDDHAARHACRIADGMTR